MKINLLLFAGIGFFLLLVSLCIPAYLSQPNRSLMLAVPIGMSSPTLNVHDLDEFSKDNFLLTYEIQYPEKISLPHLEFPVTLTATSSSYKDIFGYSMVNGSFFSYQAWTGRLRHAVLNEAAAFTIFGSYNIAGNSFRVRDEIWLITGVIQDGYEDQSRIYVPSSVQGGNAGALAMMISAGLDETFMINSLKNANVRESEFEFISFKTQSSLLWERALVLLLGFAGFLLLSLIMPLIAALKKAWAVLRNEHESSYIQEILKKNKKLLFGIVLPALGLAALTAFTLIIFINIAAICLPWQDIPSVGRLNINFFHYHLERIYILELVSRVLFILSLVNMGVFFFLLNLKIDKKLRAISN